MQHTMRLHKVHDYGEPVVVTDKFCAMVNESEDIVLIEYPCVVWLVATSGPPRQYWLAWRFVGEEIERCEHGRFRWQVVGKDGREFDPKLLVRGETLDRLFFLTNGFSTGFTLLDNATVADFERMVLEIDNRPMSNLGG